MAAADTPAYTSVHQVDVDIRKPEGVYLLMAFLNNKDFLKRFKIGLERNETWMAYAEKGFDYLLSLPLPDALKKDIDAIYKEYKKPSNPKLLDMIEQFVKTHKIKFAVPHYKNKAMINLLLTMFETFVSFKIDDGLMTTEITVTSPGDASSISSPSPRKVAASIDATIEGIAALSFEDNDEPMNGGEEAVEAAADPETD